MGALVGLATGYYLGAKAGRERYVQLNAWLRTLRRSEACDVATDKAKAVLDLGMERTREFVQEHRPNHHDVVQPSSR